VPDDLKNYKQDSFSIFDSEMAGAILGGIVAALIVYDLGMRLILWAVG
jgi:hypothetical protein